MIDAIAAVFIVLGGLFVLIAGIGLLRLGDIYLRMHAATKAGTLGLALVCVGVMILAETWGQVAEAGFVFLFAIATAPVGAHLLGRAAFRGHVQEVPGTTHDDDCADFRSERSS